MTTKNQEQDLKGEDLGDIDLDFDQPAPGGTIRGMETGSVAGESEPLIIPGVC